MSEKCEVTHDFCLARYHTFEDLEGAVNKFLREHDIVSVLPYCLKSSKYDDELGYLIVYERE